MISTGEFAAIVVFGIGALLFWANPKRKVNRAVFACSAVVAAWLEFTHLLLVDPGLFWLRWTHAAGNLAPLTLWMVKESILGTFQFRNPLWIRRNFFWFAFSALLVALPFTEFFIPSYSTHDVRV